MILPKYLLFARQCDSDFEVGRQSRVGVLEVTIFDICKFFSKNLCNWGVGVPICINSAVI